MRSGDPGSAFLAEAIEMLREADRMHRQFFALGPARSAGPTWEPPVDIVESEQAMVIRVALPGAAPDTVEVTTDGASLTVRAVRPLNVGPGDAIHRLEIPYGRFERKVELPTGRYEIGDRQLANGCLVLTLRRLT